MSIDDDLAFLTRGCVEVLPEGQLAVQLAEAAKEKRPLRIKAGFDPTAPDIHLGHTVLLTLLSRFQHKGHHVVLVIGDFTARIGDPTGRSETRPQLTTEQIEENTTTYTEQVFKVLDPDKTQVVNNSEWLGKMDLATMIGIAARYNVAPMMTRDDFAKRYKDGHAIAIHEFLYPLMQGYDSVEIQPDIEVGGTDQKFNLLVGRDLMRSYDQRPQSIITVPLLEGTDGVKKMSKSYDNYIGVADKPDDMFGKVMSISDKLMFRYIELLTDWEIAPLEMEHPMDVKKRLAEELVSRYHSEDEALKAREGFEGRFSKKEVPEELEEVRLVIPDADVWLPELLEAAELVPSRSEARRRIQSGAVQVDGEKVDSQQARIPVGGPYVVRAGKLAMKRITIVKG